MLRARSSAGDTIPAGCRGYRSPRRRNCGSSSTHRSFAVRGRDLDPRAEEFIVEWPIREEAHLFDRLSTMPVKIEYNETATSAAWPDDWPAVPAPEPRSRTRRDHEGGLVRRHAMSSDDTGHHHTPDEERQIREAALDQTIEASIPASDPPSSNPNPHDHAALERQRSGSRQQDTAGLDGQGEAARMLRD